MRVISLGTPCFELDDRFYFEIYFYGQLIPMIFNIVFLDN